MSSAARFPASPAQRPARYNYDASLSCPRCFRGAGALSRPAVERGLYRCAGCAARFRFEPETDSQLATLVHVPYAETEYRPTVNDRCSCGAFTGGGSCQTCRNQEQREAREAGR